MNPKYQVFVSSTYKDLQAERDQVIKAVLEMNHIPVGMEMFSAADEEQWAIIARHIDESDYYAVVIAHRYGSTTDDGISYTRKEYEYALAKGVPVLGFIIDDKAKWPADRVDKDPELVARLDDFKELAKKKPVHFWKSADDLHGKFSISLVKAITATPREGWIRASAAVGPEVTSELSRLSAENARLRAQAANKIAERDAAFQKIDNILEQSSRKLEYRVTKGASWKTGNERSLAFLFDVMASRMIAEIELDEACGWIAMNIKLAADDSVDIVPVNQVQDLLADFASLDLVETSRKKHSVHDEGEYWSLSDEGRLFLKWRRRHDLELEIEAAERARRPARK